MPTRLRDERPRRGGLITGGSALPRDDDPERQALPAHGEGGAKARPRPASGLEARSLDTRPAPCRQPLELDEAATEIRVGGEPDRIAPTRPLGDRELELAAHR